MQRTAIWLNGFLFPFVSLLLLTGCQQQPAPARQAAGRAGGAPLAQLTAYEKTLPDETQQKIADLRTKGVAANWAFEVGATEALRYPLKSITGGKREDATPQAVEQQHKTASEILKTLPKAGGAGDANAPVFDLRAQGKVSPVQNQNPCGDCWAFAGIGVYESSYLIVHNNLFDSSGASEQHILNCHTHFCDQDYFLSKVAQFLVDAGTTTRHDEPYQHQAKPCDPQIPVRYNAVTWDWVTGVGPNSVKDIKRALVSHGAVGSYIQATTALQGFRGTGVFNEFASTGDGHFVTIIGWDDTKTYTGGSGKGAWIVKNSWGTSWGNGGIGYIAYDCNAIGTDALWILAK